MVLLLKLQLILMESKKAHAKQVGFFVFYEKAVVMY